MHKAKTIEISGVTVAKLATCWRILHMMTSSYGNQPTGQVVIALTIHILEKNDYSPTTNEICQATGIPKVSVARYVNWQLKEGLLEEIVDPSDRRLRRLQQTEKGRVEMQWLDSQLDSVWREVSDIAERVEDRQRKADPVKVLERMIEHTRQQQRRVLT